MKPIGPLAKSSFQDLEVCLPALAVVRAQREVESLGRPFEPRRLISLLIAPLISISVVGLGTPILR